ncbi:hypothetical protein Tco_1202463 [Tanacetum coccineum]
MIENLTYPIFMSLVLSAIPLMTVKTLLTVMASEQFSSGPEPKLLTPGIINSGLVPNIPSSTPYVLPTKNDWEILFQPMFDEYLTPPPCVDLLDTPMVEKSKLDEDPQGIAIDPIRYRGMIGTIMYLTSRFLHYSNSFCRWLTKGVARYNKSTYGSNEAVWTKRKSNGGKLFTYPLYHMYVLFTKRVKISSTNIRLETTVPQKEETFQVVIDLIKNSKCFKAFTISADVPEIFMQQFWYTIKKTILDIYLRVEGVDFIDVPDDDATLVLIIKLGYKGLLYKHTNMFVDHMHQPWRTLAAIINKCLSGKTASNEKLKKRRDQDVKICHSPDSPRLKFVRIGEDYQEYGLPIPETMLTEAIKQSEYYQMFIKHSTGQIPPKKRRDVALELGKSISKTEAEEAARQVHVTYARIVTESVPEPTRRIKSRKVTSDPPKRLKGVPSLTLEEQEGADTMQALKESRKTSRRQPDTGGSNKGTCTIPGVLDESTVVSATSSEGNEDQLDDEEKDDKDGDSDDEGDDLISDTQDADDEDAETESDVDEIYKYKIHVHKDVDTEMAETETVEHENKEKDVITDATKPDVGKSAEEEGDAEKATTLTFKSKSLHNFHCHLLVYTAEVDVSSLMGIHIQQETPQIQSLSVQTVPVSMILETTNLPPIPEILTETPVSTAVSSPHVTPTILTMQQTSTPIPTPPITTDAPTITTVIPESDALFVVQLRVAKLEYDVSELKKIDLSAKALTARKT